MFWENTAVAQAKNTLSNGRHRPQNDRILRAGITQLTGTDERLRMSMGIDGKLQKYQTPVSLARNGVSQ
jgi:hypothetical protein